MVVQMKHMKLVYTLLLLLPLLGQAQDKTKANKTTESSTAKPAIEPIVTKGSITINGKAINYTATSGYLPLKDEKDKAKANIFFVAYTVDGADKGKRPITYTFNGGPGSSSVWLHMGALGPKRVVMSDKGDVLTPPYQYINNEYSWLDKTDLVFIDPVTTGYSRAAEGEDDKQFHGYTEDIQVVGDFIRLYTTKYQRWGSPKYLCGESYGTTRAAGLSGYLQNRYNMYLNGVALVSSILNFQTARFDSGNDLPSALFLPSYTATAYYHKKLSTDLQNKPLKEVLKDAEEFALTDYSHFLFKGDLATDNEKITIQNKLAMYTGLNPEYIAQCNYRINIFRFCKELRRKDGVTVGRLDSRITGKDADGAGDSFDFDPSLEGTISGPYSASLNNYIRTELKYENDLPYEILTGRVHPWSYKNVQNQYLNVGETLRESMSKNPSLKVWVANGYMDLATPYFATDYTFNHMGLTTEQHQRVKMTFYEAGHMMYIHKPSLLQLKKDADEFYK